MVVGMDSDRYFELWQLIVLFGEDYDLFGEAVEEITLSYAGECPKELREEIINQIDDFKRNNSGNIDAAFLKTFGRLGRHDMWGYTPSAFLDELKRLLKQ